MTGGSEERWRKLQASFEQAMDLPPGDRAAFLAALDADEHLKRELHGMIRVASSGGVDLSQPIAALAGTASAAPAHPRRFGPYRIVREIGHGGMGVVYEAVREDEFHQRVALKIAPQWRGEEQLHARIRHERQVLAGLDHPNIARLIDGGSENGVPYFAMEYVEGIPITAFLHDRRPPLPARIALFQQVLAAVHYAHLNMVVHRDLKPSNILVTSEGVPKLLDFGIAKILDPMAGPGVTGTGMQWTPDYASPEQVRGLPVTAQTDVYSLALVLFEMLTGRRAQTADMSSPLALDKSICETEPARIGTELLHGDLLTIVFKAMSKEPSRRYESAAEFSADLTRCLNGLPVTARPNTFAYRASKFLRRHKGLAAGAALLAASVVAGFVSTLHQARQAESRFQQVRSLANAFVFDIHDRIQFLPGSTPARQAIVATALRYLENLQQSAGADADLARELAGAYHRIGDVQGNPTISNLGDRDGALASYRKAQSLLAPLVAQGDNASRLPLAGIETGLAMVRKEKGETKVALSHYQRACALADDALAGNPADRSALHFTANLYADWTRTLMQLNDPRAPAAAERAMLVARRLVAADPSRLDSLATLATAHNSLAAVFLSASQLEKAATGYRQSVELRSELVRRAADNVSYRRDLVVGLGTLGEVLGTRTGENLGDTAGAIAALRSALEHTRWLRRNDAADKRAVFDDLSVRMRLGAALLEGGMAQDALGLLRAALEENEALVKNEPGNYRFTVASGYLMRKEAEALAALGRNQEAVGAYRRAMERYAPLTSGPTGSSVVFSIVIVNVQIAGLLAATNPKAALEAANQAAALIAKSPQSLSVPWTKAKIPGDLGRLYQRLGDAARARPWLERSIAVWKQLRPPKALEAARQKEQALVEASLAHLAQSKVVER
ncbi:MAG: protein kinase [Bryobacterales bacterium]|nr:protein kinase [Bryobacterales bacterium]